MEKRILPTVPRPANCVVLLSGGFFSAVLLGLACEQYGRDRVIGLSVDYGQSHRVELKSEIVGEGRRLRVPMEKTISCYRGTACGECLACQTRAKAFAP